MDDEKKLMQSETAAVSGGGRMPGGEEVTPGEGYCCPYYVCAECCARVSSYGELSEQRYSISVKHLSCCSVGRIPYYVKGHNGSCENCLNWLGGGSCEIAR